MMAMGRSSACRDGHQAYLNALDRTLWAGLAASLALHVLLVELLPSPFHHPHPAPRTLDVTFVTPPSPPAPLPQEPDTAPSPAPAAAAPRTAPQPKPEAKPPAKPKPAQATPAIARSTPPPLTLPATAPSLAAVPTTMAPPTADVQTPPDRLATAQAKAESAEAGPVSPPSFRAGYLHNPEPVYPTASRRLGEEGTVQLRVLVSAEGRPLQVDVHRSSTHPRLDEAALAAVRAWRFVAAKRGETAIEAPVIVPIVFRLESLE